MHPRHTLHQVEHGLANTMHHLADTIDHHHIMKHGSSHQVEHGVANTMHHLADMIHHLADGGSGGMVRVRLPATANPGDTIQSHLPESDGEVISMVVPAGAEPGQLLSYQYRRNSTGGLSVNLVEEEWEGGEYLPSAEFAGRKEGFVFKTGARGLGEGARSSGRAAPSGRDRADAAAANGGRAGRRREGARRAGGEGGGHSSAREHRTRARRKCGAADGRGGGVRATTTRRLISER